MSGSAKQKGWRGRLAHILAPGVDAGGAELEGLELPVTPDELLYARGYLLTKSARPAVIDHWRVHRVAGHDLYTDPRVRVEVAEAGSRRAWLVGDAFDPDADVYRDVPAYLLAGGLLDRLDTLAGRYVLFIQDNDRLEVYHDAMGMRSVFYGHETVASHAALVAQVARAPLREWVMPFITSRGYSKRDVKYLPGLDAPFEGVRQLTPNTRLVLPGFQVERYWPRHPRIECDRAAAVQALIGHVTGLRHYMEANAISPILGVSAGRDSRCLLAALAPMAPRLFTFVRSEGAKSTVSADSRTASALAERCGLDLEVVKVAAPSTLDEASRPFGMAFRRNTGYVRGPTATWIEHFVDNTPEDLVFVRGFGGEVMRGFYRPMRGRNVTSLSTTYDVNAGSRLTREAFERFIEVTYWNKADFRGYEPSDVFYWEHRMGTWGASALSESDMAFRSMAGYNSRALFQAFMGLPASDRATSALFEEATQTMMPELAGVPYSG